MLDRCKNRKIDNLEGTMYFYPPETCDDETCEEDYDGYPLDIWALGVTLYAMTFLELPFVSKTKNYMELVEMISKADVKFPDTRRISEGLKKIILSMLVKDPKKRVTCKELKLNPWLNEGRVSLSDL